MKQSCYAALAFILAAPDCQSLDDLEEAFSTAIGSFGFSSFGCIHFAAPGRPIAPRRLFGRDPHGWTKSYVDAGLACIDPTLPLVFSHGAPFSWDEVISTDLSSVQALVFDKAARAGLHSGFVVPVAGCYGDISAVVLASDGKSELDADARATLTAVATVFATYGRSLVEFADDAPTATPLTRREAECLTWVAQGKTDWEIGHIVGISPRTVGFYIDSARSKLGCVTRTQAVVEAWRHGWLVSLMAPHLDQVH